MAGERSFFRAPCPSASRRGVITSGRICMSHARGMILRDIFNTPPVPRVGGHGGDGSRGHAHPLLNLEKSQRTVLRLNRNCGVSYTQWVPPLVWVCPSLGVKEEAEPQLPRARRGHQGRHLGLGSDGTRVGRRTRVGQAAAAPRRRRPCGDRTAAACGRRLPEAAARAAAASG